MTPRFAPGAHTTRATRVLRAPPARVFAALTDAREIAAWRVPDGMVAEVHLFEPWEGGRQRISLTYQEEDGVGKTAGRTDTYGGVFLRLVPDREVVEELAFEAADPAFAGPMRITKDPHARRRRHPPGRRPRGRARGGAPGGQRPGLGAVPGEAGGAGGGGVSRGDLLDGSSEDP